MGLSVPIPTCVAVRRFTFVVPANCVVSDVDVNSPVIFRFATLISSAVISPASILARPVNTSLSLGVASRLVTKI